MNETNNKALVEQFINDILIAGNMDKLGEYFNGNDYIQHNPSAADGLDGLGEAMATMAKMGITMKYEKIHLLLAENDLVLAVSEGEYAGKHTSFYDIFRVQDGKIAEHWDNIEAIPETSEWKNNNGKFGF